MVFLGPTKHVLVHTTPQGGSNTYDGYLVRKKGEIVLDAAHLVTGTGDEDRVQIQGRVHIPREHVAFWQVLA